MGLYSVTLFPRFLLVFLSLTLVWSTQLFPRIYGVCSWYRAFGDFPVSFFILWYLVPSSCHFSFNPFSSIALSNETRKWYSCFSPTTLSTASSRSTPIVLNAFGGVDFVLTHPSPSVIHPQQQQQSPPSAQQQPQPPTSPPQQPNEEIPFNLNPSSLSLPPPVPSSLPTGSSGWCVP